MTRLTVQDLVNGYFDKLVDSLSGRTAKRIDRDDRRYQEKVEEIREELRQRGQGGTRLIDQVADLARNSVNAGKRMEERWDIDPTATATPRLMPCRDSPGERCSGRIEYTVVVVMVDPTGGGTARFPVVVSSTEGLTQAQLAALAGAAARSDEQWRASGAKGGITQDTATPVEVIVTSIVGRD